MSVIKVFTKLINMKRYFLFKFLLFNIFIFSQNEKAILEVNYELKIINDSLNRDRVSFSNYTLLSNNSTSIYFNKDAKKFYDYLYNQKEHPFKLSQNGLSSLPKIPKHKVSSYKVDDKLFVFLPVGKYIYTFQEDSLVWDVLSEKKYIKNYKCKLAKTVTDTGDTFYAWFTEDVPISEGPFRFKGLTGLILEVYNQNKTIEIIATDIKKSDELIESLTYGKNLIALKSKSQFLEARKNYFDNPAAYNSNVKVLDSNGDDLNKKIADKIKKTNVFLD